MARKILLADDSVTAQNMGRKILADAGYEVITVNNGSAALKKIAELRPDLIVLDVYMPGYSGLEVCQRLKEVAESSRIPVLLTVGKLEPFKPEEARRVRADGYIVKPFEASELLSALSKLEDKIVPRAESSKPGRLARASAAIDDGRFDRTVATEEDSGWKNRIAFPSKKKKETAESDSEDPAMYNAVNKDLRTVVEHKAVESPKGVPAEEERVDLGALAPEGLPKDVTPEEIAALAAAASQVKLAEEKAASDFAQERKASAPIEAETHTLEQTAPKTEAVAEAPAIAPQTSREEPQTNLSDPVVAATVADATTAIATPEKESPEAVDKNSADHSLSPKPSSEPVTMAIAASAGTDSGFAPSRWTAVPVALAPEESSVSLEQEMEKAHTAFLAASNAPEPVASMIPSAGAEAALEFSSPVEGAAPEPVPSTPSTSVPEATNALSEVASAASEAITAAVQELEAAAASYVEQSTPVTVASPAPSETTSSSAPEGLQISQEQDKEKEKVEQAATPVAEIAAEEPVKIETPAAEVTQPTSEQSRSEEFERRVPAVDAPIAHPPVIEDRAAEPVAESSNNAPPEQPPVETAVVTASEPIAKSTPEATAHKEPDIAATTAAAWASWRRIRESDSTAKSPADSMHASSAHDDAAMAVAAGAENHPEDAASSDDSDPAIASIVDSVLADLRPKIFEEVSRKLGKKK